MLLIILIKLYYFQKDLNKRISLPYDQIPKNNNDNNFIFLLSKNILDIYKKHFGYKTLKELLI